MKHQSLAWERNRNQSPPVVARERLRWLLATNRFKKDYAAFCEKYPAFADKMRDFVRFRRTASPDQSFGTKDAILRFFGNGYRRCHIIHGKAILLYQLTGNEVRLTAVVDHDTIETKKDQVLLLNYTRSLTENDFVTYALPRPFVGPAKAAAEPSEPEAEQAYTPLTPEQEADLKGLIIGMALHPEDHRVLDKLRFHDVTDFLHWAREAIGVADNSRDQDIFTALGGRDLLAHRAKHYLQQSQNIVAQKVTVKPQPPRYYSQPAPAPVSPPPRPPETPVAAAPVPPLRDTPQPPQAAPEGRPEGRPEPVAEPSPAVAKPPTIVVVETPTTVVVTTPPPQPAAVEPPPKRPRGRPRIHPLPEAGEARPKRPPGRPPKAPLPATVALAVPPSPPTPSPASTGPMSPELAAAISAMSLEDLRAFIAQAKATKEAKLQVEAAPAAPRPPAVAPQVVAKAPRPVAPQRKPPVQRVARGPQDEETLRKKEIERESKRQIREMMKRWKQQGLKLD